MIWKVTVANNRCVLSQGDTDDPTAIDLPSSAEMLFDGSIRQQRGTSAKSYSDSFTDSVFSQAEQLCGGDEELVAMLRKLEQEGDTRFKEEAKQVSFLYPALIAFLTILGQYAFAQNIPVLQIRS